MPIRISCLDKVSDGQQVVERNGFIAPSVTNPKASYTGRQQEFRILCGSI